MLELPVFTQLHQQKSFRFCETSWIYLSRWANVQFQLIVRQFWSKFEGNRYPLQELIHSQQMSTFFESWVIDDWRLSESWQIIQFHVLILINLMFFLFCFIMFCVYSIVCSSSSYLSSIKKPKRVNFWRTFLPSLQNISWHSFSALGNSTNGASLKHCSRNRRYQSQMSKWYAFAIFSSFFIPKIRFRNLHGFFQ